MKRTGLSIILTGVCNIGAFLAAAVIPIPALRTFALQAAVLITFNSLSMFTMFPALMSFDLKRVSYKKVDIFCCYSPPKNEESSPAVENSLNSYKDSVESLRNPSQSPPPPYEDLEVTIERTDRKEGLLTWAIERYYIEFLRQTFVKTFVIVFCCCLTGTGIYGIIKLEDGLNLTEVVPRNTTSYNFLVAQKKYLGFYHMYAVTQGNFEYPQDQKILYDYQSSFVRIPTLIKNDDGGLPEFWLSLFRDWLLRLQKAFDDDFAAGYIYDGGWEAKEASADGILAYKLLVQTGHVDYPVDETLLQRNRLVDSHGMINPSAFYNYLSAWYSNDAMAYNYAQGNLVPTPKEWYHDAADVNLIVPKSLPIVYAQIPFYLNINGDTEEMVDTISQVRAICEKFAEKGLPNFPRGNPFTFWEQYIELRFWLLISLVTIIGVVLILVAVVMANPWLSILLCLVVATITTQLFGVMSILGIKLSAISSLILITSIGIGMEFTFHIAIVSLADM